MELAGFEAIIETLLVGAIVSLWLLSLVFFFFGHIFRVEVGRRFFQFLLYEEDELQEAVQNEDAKTLESVIQSVDEKEPRDARRGRCSWSCCWPRFSTDWAWSPRPHRTWACSTRTRPPRRTRSGP